MHTPHGADTLCTAEHAVHFLLSQTVEWMAVETFLNRNTLKSKLMLSYAAAQRETLLEAHTGLSIGKALQRLNAASLVESVFVGLNFD